MFTPGIMVTEMSKIAHCLNFLLIESERSYLALSENAMDCWVLSYH